MYISKADIHNFSQAFINSYSQVFFSTNKVLGSLLLLVSFFDITAGLNGAIAILTGTLLVEAVGMDKLTIQKGLYGFNNLLVGLGLGLNFELSVQLITIVIFASLLTTLFTFSAQGILGKYALSYLSIPFLFAIWISFLATNKLSALGLSVRGIYTHNEIYAIGGLTLLEFYNWAEQTIPFFLNVYFKSLGAIFFQYNILAGILISIGLLFYSRIVFSLSILGYFMAVLFYELFGANTTELSYSYIGFNYILAAIAIGGYFLVPSRSSYIAALLLLPLVVLLSFGLEQIFATFNLPIYSLPFNLLVLMFLYLLRFRTSRPTHLQEVYIQQDTPEQNVYLRKNYVTRLRTAGVDSIMLPVMGEWEVSQGYSGSFTHKGDWRHAVDFVVTNNEGKQFKNQGDYPADYFCYGKNVIAPADGYVTDTFDGIEDNIIGQMDLVHNWGNTIVIQHKVGLCSQVSHLQKGSLLVKIGDFVKKGQLIAKVGNTGRSPYPHLHFQMQAAPYVGSKTLDYPLSNYTTCNENHCRYHAHGTPAEGEKLSNVVATPIIANAFTFNPSKQFKFKLDFAEDSSIFNSLKKEYTFQVHSDVFKNTYFECQETGAKAWFSTDGQVHFFSNYTGNRNSFLYYFMLALFKVELGYNKNVLIKDQIPTHFTFKGLRLFFQDFTAPFFHYLHSNYELKFGDIDDDFAPQNVTLHSEIKNKVHKKIIHNLKFDIAINASGIYEISLDYKGEKCKATSIKIA